MAMKREKGGRQSVFGQIAEIVGWLQTRRLGDDLLMICKDCTKAGKKKAFMTGCINFQQ